MKIECCECNDVNIYNNSDLKFAVIKCKRCSSLLEFKSREFAMNRHLSVRKMLVTSIVAFIVLFTTDSVIVCFSIIAGSFFYQLSRHLGSSYLGRTKKLSQDYIDLIRLESRLNFLTKPIVLLGVGWLFTSYLWFFFRDISYFNLKIVGIFLGLFVYRFVALFELKKRKELADTLSQEL